MQLLLLDLWHIFFGMSDDDQQRFPCRHCGRQLRADEQPCPGCGNRGMAITQQVDERINIQERRTRILATLERDLRFLLASIAITVVAPIITPQLHLNEPILMIISVIAGLVAFILGTYGVILVKRIHES